MMRTSRSTPTPSPLLLLAAAVLVHSSTTSGVAMAASPAFSPAEPPTTRITDRLVPCGSDGVMPFDGSCCLKTADNPSKNGTGYCPLYTKCNPDGLSCCPTNLSFCNGGCGIQPGCLGFKPAQEQTLAYTNPYDSKPGGVPPVVPVGLTVGVGAFITLAFNFWGGIVARRGRDRFEETVPPASLLPDSFSVASTNLVASGPPSSVMNDRTL